MIIEYSFFNIDGTIAKHALLSFQSKNVFKVERFNPISLNTRPYYSIYDLNLMIIQRFYSETDILFSESSVSLARWTVDQLKSNFNFLSEGEFLSYKSISFKETVVGTAAIDNFVTVINDEFILDFIDKELIDYLPISSIRMFGRQFENHGIVAKKEVNFSGIRTLFEVERITY